MDPSSRSNAARVLAESPLTLPELAARIPGSRPGGRVNTCTLTRWIQRGTRRGDGRFVRLEAVKSGGRWLTSWAAYRRFVDELTPPDGAEPSGTGGPPQCDGPRSPTARQSACELAAKELESRGA